LRLSTSLPLRSVGRSAPPKPGRGRGTSLKAPWPMVVAAPPAGSSCIRIHAVAGRCAHAAGL